MGSNTLLIYNSEITIKASPSLSYSMTVLEFQAIKILSHVSSVPVVVTVFSGQHDSDLKQQITVFGGDFIGSFT